VYGRAITFVGREHLHRVVKRMGPRQGGGTGGGIMWEYLNDGPRGPSAGLGSGVAHVKSRIRGNLVRKFCVVWADFPEVWVLI